MTGINDPHHRCMRHLVKATPKQNVERGLRSQPQPKKEKVPWWVKKDEWMMQKTLEETRKDREAVDKLKERHRKKFPQGPSSSLQGDNQYWQPKQPRPGFSVYDEKTGEHVHIPPREGDWIEGGCGAPMCQLPFVRVFCTDRRWRDIDRATGKEHWKVCKESSDKFLNPLFDLDYESRVVPNLELKDASPLTRPPPLITDEQLSLIDKQDLKNLPKLDAEVVEVVEPGGKTEKKRQRRFSGRRGTLLESASSSPSGGCSLLCSSHGRS